MKWIILTENDLERLVMFDRDVHPPCDHVTVDEYKHWIVSGVVFMVLVDLTGDWIGSVQVLKTDECATFFGFGIKPAVQGKGYSKTLMKYLQRFSRKWDLRCKTRETNVVMQTLLRASKFIHDGDSFECGESWQSWVKYKQT